MSKFKKVVQKITSCIVTLFLILSVCLAISSVFVKKDDKAKFIGDYSILRIFTPSMEPNIPVGECILIKRTDFSNVKVNDIVTFYSSDPAILGKLNTHRVVGFTTSGELITKGDNNSSRDDYTVSKDRFVGVYQKSIPFLTVVFRLFSKPIGFIALIIVPILIISVLSFKDFIFSLKKDDDKELTEKEKVMLEVEKLKKAEREKETLSNISNDSAGDKDKKDP